MSSHSEPPESKRNPETHFTQLLALLHTEREEDLQQYLRFVRQRPLSERVAQGFSWYPLKVVQTGFSLGEKAFVVVERMSQQDQPHQLRAGQTVSLFTTGTDEKHAEKSGIINYVERNRMKIILNARDVPDWIEPGPLGVDQLFDDRTYSEMEKALRKVMAAKKDRLAELRDLLVSGKKNLLQSFLLADDVEKTYSSDDFKSSDEASALNASQEAAVRNILSSNAISIIHGPPGTGKTTTVVAAVKRLCARENTVLVTAPSNTAADLLTERLAAQGLNVVRIGNVSRVDEAVLSHTLDALLAAHPESKNIRKVKLQAAEYRRQTRKHKRTFTGEDRRERDHLKHQARELEAWANTLEDRLLEEILSSAQAITCTLVGAAHPVLERYHFRTCVIDEAAQALEPAAWIPITKCSRVVLAGDPFQLPPTVKSQEAARGGLSRTLIERCIDLLPDTVSLLTVQYRMHQAIMGFSNDYFYGGALQAHESVALRQLTPFGEDDEPHQPVVFIDTAGTGFEEKAALMKGEGPARSLSRYNPEEALLLREHLLQLLDKFPEEALPSIGILSPYREQVNHLEDMVREDPRLAFLLEKQRDTGGQTGSLVNTIDGFQGQERDIIYLSLVRSNAKHEIGFLSDYRRMNVAMTRARMLLVVIGDSATIGNNAFYQAFLDYCEKEGSYETAWAYMRG